VLVDDGDPAGHRASLAAIVAAMRRAWIWIAVLVVGGLAVRSGCSSEAPAPDERLAKQFRAICKITERHVDSPRAGVQQLSRYLGDHAPDLLHDWAELLVLIERIDDDEAHDDRARLAGRRFEKVLSPCHEAMSEFADAVEGDEEATRLLQHNLERLNRSIEIILTGGAENLLRELPALVRTRFDAAIRR